MFQDDPGTEFRNTNINDPVIQIIACCDWLNYTNQEKLHILRQMQQAAAIGYAFTSHGVWLQFTN